MFCRECGARNPDDNRFCNYCGKPMVQPYPPETTYVILPGVIYCGECGTRHRDTSRFCKTCGTVLKLSRAAGSAASLQRSPAAPAMPPSTPPVPPVPSRAGRGILYAGIGAGLAAFFLFPYLFSGCAIVLGTAAVLKKDRLGAIAIVIGIGAILADYSFLHILTYYAA